METLPFSSIVQLTSSGEKFAHQMPPRILRKSSIGRTCSYTRKLLNYKNTSICEISQKYIAPATFLKIDQGVMAATRVFRGVWFFTRVLVLLILLRTFKKVNKC